MKRKLILSAILCLCLSASRAITISGTLTVCKNSTTALATNDLVVGGTWSSSNTGNATISSTTGIVTGVNAGTATITYTPVSGPYQTVTVTVNAIPNVITGSSSVCEAAFTTLACATLGGVWSSTDAGIAPINSSGIVTGVSVGSVTISYTNSNGCASTYNFVVNPLPAAITGVASACAGGATTTLYCATPGGAWSAPGGAPHPLSIDGTGVIATNLTPTPGTRTVYYTLSTGCFSSVVATSNPLPTPIFNGASSFCVAESKTFASDIGGTWSVSNSAVATVGASTGTVTGVSGGAVTISYTEPAHGCYRTKTITIYALPIISGPTFLCKPGTITLSGTGGIPITSWSSSNPPVAAINASGYVTAGSPGTTTIAATSNHACVASVVVTVGGTPGPITGGTTVCVGSSIILSNTAAGGVWSATDGTGSVNVNPTTGVVTGVGAGTATVTYSNTCGTPATIVITVVPSAGAISGAPIIDICETSTITLTSSVSGGTWTSSNPSVATINASTGQLIGANLWDVDMGATCSLSTVVTYGFYSGCSTSVTVNVNDKADSLKRNAAGVAGWDNTNLCTGLRYYIASSNEAYWAGCGGGSWTSSNPSVADVVDGPFRVRAIAPGNATIIHQRGNGCTTTLNVTVANTTAVLSPTTPVLQGDFYDDRGEVSICEEETTTINCTETGGTWTVESTIWNTSTIATVMDNDPSISHLVVRGDSGGTVLTPVVTYRHDGKCRGLNVRVYPKIEDVTNAETILGDATVCLSATNTYTFTNTIAYGEWSSNSPKLQLASTGDNMKIGRFITTGGTGTVTISYQTACGTVTKDVEIVSCGARFAQNGNGQNIENLEAGVLNYSLIPNPGNGNVTISADQELDGSVEMSVLNYTGAMVYTSPIVFRNGKTNLNLTHLSTGVYFVVLKDKATTKTLKIVIQK